MDITRVIMEMIDIRVKKAFAKATEIVEKDKSAIEKENSDIYRWINSERDKLIKEANEKFRKRVADKYGKVVSFRDDSCDAYIDSTYRTPSVDPGKKTADPELQKLFGEVMEEAKRIAIENGPKTAFSQIDKYLETVDPVKTLKLSK